MNKTPDQPIEISFEKELEILINKFSKENGSNTPDFLLAKYLTASLSIFNATIRGRSEWHGHRETFL